MAFHETVRAAFGAGKAKDAAQLPALTLAYIGDTVYDLFVRTALIERTDVKVHALHLLAAKQVCAAGQTAAFRKIEPHLTEEELGVFKRGRNAHSGTVPKNAQISDYRTATGLETLIGWLYWTGADERLTQLMHIALEGEEHGV
ncbi:MAG: ribonuclease III domain-containing protein [Clostridia bacterium]|nr:ribonuclease III domain-containing protein [Clostridia bacterium]